MPLDAFAVRVAEVDLNELPQDSPEVGVRLHKAQVFVRVGTRTKPGFERLILHPESPELEEPNFPRYLCGIRLVSDGQLVEGIGQIVITSHRIVGLITEGQTGADSFAEANGRVCIFSALFEALEPLRTSNNWRGKPVNAFFDSADGSFSLNLFSAEWTLQNDGEMKSTNLERLTYWVSSEGQAQLLPT